jgi:hypothetical protein
MWYKVGLYIAGAGLGLFGILKSYPWKPTGKYKGVFSISLVVLSLVASLVGGVCGTFKLCYEGGTG